MGKGPSYIFIRDLMYKDAPGSSNSNSNSQTSNSNYSFQTQTQTVDVYILKHQTQTQTLFLCRIFSVKKSRIIFLIPWIFDILLVSGISNRSRIIGSNHFSAVNFGRDCLNSSENLKTIQTKHTSIQKRQHIDVSEIINTIQNKNTTNEHS